MGRFIRYRPSPGTVIGFIALFVALTGTATALRGTNTVSGNDIITGAVKKSDVGKDAIGTSEAREDNDKGGGFTGAQVNEGTLDFQCPAGTQQFAGACFETTIRGTREWGAASDECQDLDRRLPTASELRGFRREPGITLGSPKELSANVHLNGATFQQIRVDDAGFIDAINNATPSPFRCVAGLAR